MLWCWDIVQGLAEQDNTLQSWFNPWHQMVPFPMSIMRMELEVSVHLRGGPGDRSRALSDLGTELLAQLARYDQEYLPGSMNTTWKSPYSPIFLFLSQ